MQQEIDLRLMDGERLYLKSWSGSTSLVGFVREIAAWLGYVDPKHEAGKIIQQKTKGMHVCQQHSQDVMSCACRLSP